MLAYLLTRQGSTAAPPTEHSSYLPPPEDSLPVDVETNVDDTDFGNVTSQQSAPPDSD